MSEYKETHEVRSESGKSTSPWLAFAVGALLIAVVSLLVMNVHGRFNGPGGSFDVNVRPPTTSSAPAVPAPAAPPPAAPTR